MDTASCNWLKEMSSGSFSLDKDAFLILVSSAKTGSFTERLTHIGEEITTPCFGAFTEITAPAI